MSVWLPKKTAPGRNFLFIIDLTGRYRRIKRRYKSADIFSYRIV